MSTDRPAFENYARAVELHARLVSNAQQEYSKEIDSIHAEHGQSSAAIGMPLIKKVVDKLIASRASADAALRDAFDAAVRESILHRDPLCQRCTTPLKSFTHIDGQRVCMDCYRTLRSANPDAKAEEPKG